MAENNDIFGESANFLYLEPVEGEEGKSLNLSVDLRNKFVGLLQSRFDSAESARNLD